MLPMKSKTMTLKEITDLLDVRHDVALKKVERLARSPEFGTMLYLDIVYNDKGQKIKTVSLNKRQSIAVAGVINTTLLMRVIDRWIELESEDSTQSLPTSFAEALQLAADQAKQLELQAPMVEVYERLADRKHDVNTTALAKQLGCSAKTLNAWLKAKGFKWVRRDYPMSGYESWFNVVSDVTGSGHEYIQCLITPKGQIEIAKRWMK